MIDIQDLMENKYKIQPERSSHNGKYCRLYYIDLINQHEGMITFDEKCATILLRNARELIRACKLVLGEKQDANTKQVSGSVHHDRR